MEQENPADAARSPGITKAITALSHYFEILSSLSRLKKLSHNVFFFFFF